jgi:Tfp pilus assembly protein PilF
MNIKIFIKECSNRDVFKRLSIYIVTSWVLLQVLSVIAEPLNLPEKSIPVLILALIIGFPIYIIYIWKSRLSSSWESDEDDTTSELIDKSKFRTMYFSILGIIIFVSGLSAIIIINNSFSNVFNLPKLDSNDKIAVLKFTNNTGVDSLNIIGNMTEDWISHGITENSAGQIISPNIVKDYTNVIKSQSLNLSDNEVLSIYLKPGKKVTGSYFLDNGKLIFNCSIENGITGETLISLKSIECDSNNALNCIESLKSKIVTYLVKEKKGDLSFEIQPPNYAAYRAFLEAKSYKREGDLNKYLNLLNKSIALDSSFFEPKTLKIAHYYNQGDYAVADSLIEDIKKEVGLNMQYDLLKNYEALIDGNNRMVNEYDTKTYLKAPYDLGTNTSQMVTKLQFVNRPEQVENIFSVTQFDNFSLENCKDCVTRISIMGIALNELNEYKKTIELLEPHVDIIRDKLFLQQIFKAYVNTNNKGKVDQIIEKLKLKLNKGDWVYLNLFIARQFLLINNNEDAKSYLNSVITDENKTSNAQLVAEAYYELGDYVNAENMFTELIKEQPFDIKINAYLSMCYFKNGKKLKGNLHIDVLENLRAPYQYGIIDYRLAQIYADKDDEEMVFEYLLKSIAAGNFYGDETFKNSPSFAKFLNSEKWKEIMTYWQ